MKNKTKKIKSNKKSKRQPCPFCGEAVKRPCKNEKKAQGCSNLTT